MKKVVLIGKNSYIAKNLAEYIRKMDSEIQVRQVSASNGEWEEEDFTGVDSVVVLAAIVHRKETKENKNLYYEVNVKLPEKIAQKAKISGVRQLVFLSTIAVYGNKQTVIDKDTKVNPVTEYAKTKLLAEDTLSQLGSDEFKVAIVRPPMVYGKNCPGNFSKLVRLIRKAHIFPETKNKRSVIFIDNLCSCLLQIIKKEANGIYHPQDGQYLCTSDIAKAIKQDGTSGIIFIIPGFGGVLQKAGVSCSLLGKIFGSLQCDMELSNFEELAYLKVTQDEAIRKSIILE